MVKILQNRWLVNIAILIIVLGIPVGLGLSLHADEPMTIEEQCTRDCEFCYRTGIGGHGTWLECQTDPDCYDECLRVNLADSTNP